MRRPLFCAAILIALSASGSEPQRFEHAGIAVEFSFEPAGGADASGIATFRVTDARTGRPLPGLRPRAWLSARRSEAVAEETACSDKIRGFLAGQLSVRADADLNSYLLVTLNHDRTVAFINPQIASNISKLESIVVLPANGADWVLSRNRDLLFVTMPEQSAVAVIDTLRRKLLRTLSTGEGSRPGRIALAPDGSLWVSLDGAERVAVFDAGGATLQATPATGSGLHSVSFSGDGRHALVTNSASDDVTLVDARTFAPVAGVRTGRTPVTATWGSAARAFYVGSLNGESIPVVDPEREEHKTIPAKRGIVALAFEPEGRFLFAVNQLANEVTVIDTATNAPLTTIPVVAEPDQIAFTSRYAYVRGLGSEKFSLIELQEIRRASSAAKRNQPGAVAIQAGRLAPSVEASELTAAAAIAPTPEGNSVIIANPADRMLYFYTEGMMAPMGTFDNYKRIPRGLLVLDRSLEEVSPGVFRASVRVARGGRFDVPMFIDQPRITHCFQAHLATAPEAVEKRRPPLAAEVAIARDGLHAGNPVPFRVRLVDGVTRHPVSGLADVRLLVFESRGTWQQRQWLEEVGEGVYETRQSFPRAGTFRLLVSVESRATRYWDLPETIVEVGQ